MTNKLPSLLALVGLLAGSGCGPAPVHVTDAGVKAKPDAGEADAGVVDAGIPDAGNDGVVLDVHATPGELVFTSPAGTASAAQTLEVVNASTVKVTVTSLQIGKPLKVFQSGITSFPWALMPGGSHSITLTFNPPLGGGAAAYSAHALFTIPALDGGTLDVALSGTAT